jgi:FAD-dependent urate hydroxylase
MSSVEVLVIGAGPFGLSISAYLRSLGVQHVVVGRPLETWRTYMPAGMCLKSEPYGSVLASPQAGYDLQAFCKARGLDYVARLGPLSLDRFLDYGDWYVQHLVPEVLDDTVTQVAAVDGGFEVAFAGTGTVFARRVVVATGVRPYAHIPAELAGLPSDLVSHTIDHHDLDDFKGRSVAVVGAGQSALETAALLHEHGAHVRVIARKTVNWLTPNPEHISKLGHIRRPTNKLCEGWHCTFWNTPELYHLLPQDVKITKTRTVLGPSGSWWLKDRVDGVIEVLANHRVLSAAHNGSGVRLSLDGPTDLVDADHVVAGTGFRVDPARLPFLPDEVRSGIANVKGYPVVSRVGESTVPGLYFAGAPTAFSIGPSARFIAGTHNVAAKLAKSLARRARTGGGRVEPESVLSARDDATA